jgi:transposase
MQWKGISGLCWKAFAARPALPMLCPKEGINQNLYYHWSKEFLEAGKKRLAGDAAREANSDEVKALRSESAHLKEELAETLLEIRLLKKSCYGTGGDDT